MTTTPTLEKLSRQMEGAAVVSGSPNFCKLPTFCKFYYFFPMRSTFAEYKI